MWLIWFLKHGNSKRSPFCWRRCRLCRCPGDQPQGEEEAPRDVFVERYDCYYMLLLVLWLYDVTHIIYDYDDYILYDGGFIKCFGIVIIYNVYIYIHCSVYICLPHISWADDNMYSTCTCRIYGWLHLAAARPASDLQHLPCREGLSGAILGRHNYGWYNVLGVQGTWDWR